MKKINIIFISLLTVLIGFTVNVKAEVKELDLQTVGDLVLDANPDASSFYIVGKYVFTMKYVDTDSLNAEDLMMAAQSISLTSDDGEKVKGTKAYEKMSVYQIISKTDDDGNVIGWTVGQNLLGKNVINDNTKLEIDYIDYKKVKNVYVVTFKDDKDEEIEKQYVIAGKKANPPKYEDRVGYRFKGWYKDSDLIDFSSKEINEDLEVKQQWEFGKITVTFDSANGKSETKETVDYNEKVSAPNPVPTKEGYEFVGWFKCTSPSDCSNVEEENNAFNFETKITEEIKLQAKWKQIVRHVTFKAIVDGEEDENFYQSDKTIELTYPFNLTEDKIPAIPDGYDFVEWSTGNSTIKIPGYIVTKDDTIITGKWTIKKFKVSFDTDGGKTIGDALINYGDKLTSPGEAVKENNAQYNDYEFDGWYKCLNNDCNTLEEEQFNFQDTPITENIKLKAKFKQKVYTNQVVANFTESLKSEDLSAYTTGDTKISFNIVKADASLSQNFNPMIVALEKMLKVKNIENITIDYNSNQTLKLEPSTESSTVTSSMQEFLGKLVGKEYNIAKLEDLKDKTFKMTINLASGYTDEENDTSDVYDVEFITNFELVHNETELKEKLNTIDSDKEIIFKDWSGDISTPIEIDAQDKNIVIDARNTEVSSSITNNKYTFIIKSGNVVIKDLNLTIDVLKPSEYKKKEKEATATKNTIAIKVEKGATLTVNNVNVKTKDKLEEHKIGKESLTVANLTINENAAIELHGTLYGSNLTYESEFYGSPTVLVANDADGMMLKGLHSQNRIYNVIRTDELTRGFDDLSDVVSNYTNYYNDHNNSYISFAWYVSPKTSIHPFTFLYGDNLIVPKIFQEGGTDYEYNGATLSGWHSRNFSGKKSSEDLQNVKVDKLDTYYLYAQY